MIFTCQKKIVKKKSSSSDESSDSDSEAPKKSKKKSGWIMFCKTKREHLKEDHPDMNAAEITKELSKMWKNKSAEEKLEWKEE